MAFTFTEGAYPNTGTHQPTGYCYGNGLHVLVGDAGLILTSPDLVTWTTQTSPNSNDWRSVAWNGSLFVAVGAGAGLRTMSSADGVTWTAHSSADETASWQAVVWAATKWVAVAQSGTTRTMNSTDGSTWTGHAAAAANDWVALAYSSDLDVLVAQAFSASTSSLMHSGDKGVTWSASTTTNTWKAGGTVGVTKVAWLSSAAVFCSIVKLTSNSTFVSLTSTDGANWTPHTTIPNNTEAPGYITAAPSLNLFVSPKGCYPNVGNPMSVLTSPDGSTWTETDVTTITDVFEWVAGGWDDTSAKLVAFDNVQVYKSLIGLWSTLVSNAPVLGTKNGGTVLTLTGTGLQNVAQGDVLIDGVAALSVAPSADGTTVTCITPAHAVGAVDVTVTGIGTLTGAYTYVSVDKVIPAQGSAQGGQSITIKGYGFNATSGSPTLGGTAVASYTVDSNTQITAVTAAHASGLVDVVVPGVDTGTGLYTYTIADQPKLPPIPVFSPVASNGLISPDWTLWLQAVKARVESPITIAPEQVVGGNALTAVSDTNVLATLTGTPASALLKAVTLTLGWEGFLPVPRGGTGVGAVSAGSLLYASAAQILSELTIGAANTFLKSDGSVPAWTAGAALTKTDDTNVTLTLGGSAANALVNAASITVGWTGTLASGRGGTGFGTYAKGDLLYASATNVLSKLAASTDGKVLTLVSGVPAWATTTGLGTFNETPSGTINGSNTVFTTAGAYQAGTLRVYLNGVRAKSADYTETTPASGTFTMATAPTTGDLLRVDYGGVGTAIDAGNITSGTLADARLSNTGVSAATYGDSTHIPQIAVDAHGRITSASNVAIGAAGALVLLETHTASASSSLDFTTRNATGQSGATFQSDYDEYLIEFVGLVPATNNVGIGLRVTTDGGTTWISTGSYAWTHWVYGPAGTGQTANTAQTEIRVIGFVNVSSTSTFAVNGCVRLFSPLSTALHKAVGGQITFWDTGPSLVVDMFSGAYSATSAINGIRVIATSGNLASGSVRIYGVAKS